LARAVAAQLLDAMQIEPVPLGGALPLGDRRLLTMTVTEAARYYSVSNHVVGRRLRPDHFVTTDFVSSGHISVEFCNIPG
jgi:hypothetical protein